MLHARRTPVERAMAAFGPEFVPLGQVVDLAQRIAEDDANDPAVIAYHEAREFEVRLAHERDEEADPWRDVRWSDEA